MKATSRGLYRRAMTKATPAYPANDMRHDAARLQRAERAAAGAMPTPRRRTIP